MIFMLKSENLEIILRFMGLIIVAIGFFRISITENFDQGKTLLLIGLLVQIVGLIFYIYNKKTK